MKNHRRINIGFNCSGIYCAIMFVISFIDLSFGIASIFTDNVLIQMLSLCASIGTLCFLVFGYIIGINNKKTTSTTILSIFDVVVGILSIFFMFNSLRIIFGFTSGTVGFKFVKTAIQTDKFKKLLGIVKPKFYEMLVRFMPTFLVSFIDKIKKKEKQKGDMIMDKVKKFLANFGTGFKNNAFTISGSILLFATGSLSCTWVVKHILSTGLLPEWASYVVGIAICVLIYGFVEFTIVKYGAENKTQVKIRKAIKNIFKLIGANDFIAKIEDIEAKAIEAEKAKIEEEAIKAEAERKIKEEEMEAERIKKEALARIQEEEKKKAEEAKAEQERIEAQKKIEEENRIKAEHEKKVQEAIDKIKSGK